MIITATAAIEGATSQGLAVAKVIENTPKRVNVIVVISALKVLLKRIRNEHISSLSLSNFFRVYIASSKHDEG